MSNKVVHKWFWAWNYEKEEEWLNEMSQLGWALEKVRFTRYEFESCDPGEYAIRLQMQEKDVNYTKFVEEMGATYIGHVNQWVYFRKKTEEGPFELFSDIDSHITYLGKVGKTFWGLGLANLCIGIANSLNPVFHIGWINLLCACGLMYGLGRIHGKIDMLKKNREIME